MPKNLDNGLRYLNKRIRWTNQKKVISLLGIIFLVWFAFCLPRPLFYQPTSTVVYSSDGKLLGAKIAEDEQWRFPQSDLHSEKFKQAILHYEDAYFYWHVGFNPISISKAIIENIKAGRIVRGGSTLTQQTVRLFRRNPKRTMVEKLYELLLALRLEIGFSKDKILSFYASNAPFGGNVVGLDAASWRYFGRPPENLSWAEAATLAVLPNSPALIHVDKNRNLLEKKRNLLLHKLHDNQVIDDLTLQTSLEERLPNKTHPLPQVATHFLERVHESHTGQRVTSTIELDWQKRANRIIENHHRILEQNQVHNAAAIIIDVETKEVKAYVGNTNTSEAYQNKVDMVTAQRSTGSLLKPFLYASALDAGLLLPESIVADIPTYFKNYSPRNFSKQFSGAVPADQALAYSLNIPAVRLLQEYGIGRFHKQLQKLELSGVKFSASHYGLPLILGGAESSLWDLSRAFAGMASTLHDYNSKNQYYANQFSQLEYDLNAPQKKGRKRNQFDVFSAASIWLTFEALTEVKRPADDQTMKYFTGSQKIAWKTGTSYGNKDAWSIGVTPKYVIGVWVGNADGEGRPNTTGLQSAAPILFDLLDILPDQNEWFAMPQEELYGIEVCANSGYLPSRFCEEKKLNWISKAGLRSEACPYHKFIHTTSDFSYQVDLSCADASPIITSSWFVLPPAMERYYTQSNPTYKILPPEKEDCDANQSMMSFIYPPSNANLSIPRNVSGKKEKIVIELTHKNPKTVVHWSLDDQYLGETKDIHKLSIQPNEGRHLLSATDEQGQQIFRYFTIK